MNIDQLTSQQNFDAMSVIKEQITKIKLLTNDNNIRQQQVDILKDKLQEFEEELLSKNNYIVSLKEQFQALQDDLYQRVQIANQQQEGLEKINQELYISLQDQQQKIEQQHLELQNLKSQLQQSLEEKELFKLDIKNSQNHEVELQNLKKKQRTKIKEIGKENEELKNKVNELNKDIVKLQLNMKELHEEVRKKENLLLHNEEVINRMETMKEKLEKENAEQINIKTELRDAKRIIDDFEKDKLVAASVRQHQEELIKIKNLEIEALRQSAEEIKRENQFKERELLIMQEQFMELQSQTREEVLQIDNIIKQQINYLKSNSIDLETFETQNTVEFEEIDSFSNTNNIKNSDDNHDYISNNANNQRSPQFQQKKSISTNKTSSVQINQKKRFNNTNKHIKSGQLLNKNNSKQCIQNQNGNANISNVDASTISNTFATQSLNQNKGNSQSPQTAAITNSIGTINNFFQTLKDDLDDFQRLITIIIKQGQQVNEVNNKNESEIQKLCVKIQEMDQQIQAISFENQKLRENEAHQINQLQSNYEDKIAQLQSAFQERELDFSERCNQSMQMLQELRVNFSEMEREKAELQVLISQQNEEKRTQQIKIRELIQQFEEASLVKLKFNNAVYIVAELGKALHYFYYRLKEQRKILTFVKYYLQYYFAIHDKLIEFQNQKKINQYIQYQSKSDEQRILMHMNVQQNQQLSSRSNEIIRQKDINRLQNQQGKISSNTKKKILLQQQSQQKYNICQNLNCKQQRKLRIIGKVVWANCRIFNLLKKANINRKLVEDESLYFKKNWTDKHFGQLFTRQYLSNTFIQVDEELVEQIQQIMNYNSNNQSGNIGASSIGSPYLVRNSLNNSPEKIEQHYQIPREFEQIRLIMNLFSSNEQFQKEQSFNQVQLSFGINYNADLKKFEGILNENQRFIYEISKMNERVLNLSKNADALSSEFRQREDILLMQINELNNKLSSNQEHGQSLLPIKNKQFESNQKQDNLQNLSNIKQQNLRIEEVDDDSDQQNQDKIQASSFLNTEYNQSQQQGKDKVSNQEATCETQNVDLIINDNKNRNTSFTEDMIEQNKQVNQIAIIQEEEFLPTSDSLQKELNQIILKKNSIHNLGSDKKESNSKQPGKIYPLKTTYLSLPKQQD